MIRSVLILTILLSFIFTACGNKNAEVKAFIAESDKLASEIVQKVKADPTVSGVDAAQAMLDFKKAELKSKYDVLKAIRGFEVEEETMKKFTESVFRNAEAINNLRIDLNKKSADKEDFNRKIDKLVDDFNLIYEV